jgi:hypothetical protein
MSVDTDVANDTGFDGEELGLETGDTGESEIYTKPDEPEDSISKALPCVSVPRHPVEQKPVQPFARSTTATYTGETGSAVRDRAKERYKSRNVDAVVAARRAKMDTAVQAEQATPVAVVPVDGTPTAKTVNMPDVSEDGAVKSPHDAVYDSSPSKAVDIAKMASRYGIKPDDPLWEAFVLVIEAQAARDVAIGTLDTATKLLKDIPNQIDSRILRQVKGLADTLNTASQKVATDRAAAIQKMIDESVESGVQKMTDVASNLDSKVSLALAKLDNAIKDKVDTGIELFADSAAKASVSAVKAASSRVMVRSYIGAVVIIVLAGITGFGGAEVDNYYSAHSQMMMANGKSVLGSYAQHYMAPKNG